MALPSFPDRLRRPHRAPIAPAQWDQRVVRVLVAAPIVGVGVLLAYVWRDVPIAALLVALLAAAIVRVVVDQHNGLLATVAPLPDVHTPPVATATGLIDLVEIVVGPRHLRPTPYADPLPAAAQDAGVYRPGVHSLRALAESDAPTTAIAQVRA